MNRRNLIEHSIEGPENELCIRLRAARAALGYSQTETAELIGVSQRTISNYERGVNIPSEAAVRFLEVKVTDNPERTQILNTRIAAKALLSYEGAQLPPNILKFLRVISATVGKDTEIMADVDEKIGALLAAIIKQHGEKIAALLLE